MVIKITQIKTSILDKWLYPLVALVLLSSSVANAATSLNFTRLIITEKSKEATVRVTNEDRVPILIQSWIDRGEYTQVPDNITVPFVITQPIFRLNTKQNQLIHIIYTGSQSLPDDQESVFWVNIQEIPPKQAADANKMQIAFRTRIKLFYRPENIANSNSETAAEKLIFKVDNNRQLHIQNPTPFHITLTQITLHAPTSNITKTINPQDGMVKPKSEIFYSMPKEFNQSLKDYQISYSYIDDFGNTVTLEANQ